MPSEFLHNWSRNPLGFRFSSFLLLPAALAMLALPHAFAAEYQWSVKVESVISDETKAPPRAFLWVPEKCERVRAVVVGQHNMLEEPLLEHPAFRAALAELGFAEIWISPALGGQASFGADDVAHFDEMFRELAAASGYSEIATVPVVPIGHSAMAEFPYLFAAAEPKRTLAAISLKGSWPAEDRPPRGWSGEAVTGVPLLLVSGEYESADERAGKALWFRRKYPAVPFSMLADAGSGHFDIHDALVEFLAVYLRAAAQRRLPLDPMAPLREIDPTKEGWLVDRWRQNEPPRAPAAPVGEYTGDTRDTYWCLDEAQARATERLQSAYIGKKPQLLGYAQGAGVVAQDKSTHQQVTLQFLPDSSSDGLTFKLTGTFLDTVPEGRPVRWAARPAGSQVDHAKGGGPVVIRRICGPVEKLADDTLAIRFDRLGFDNPRRSSEIWLVAEHPGDAEFKRAVQQSVLHFPLRNREGAPQHITFPPIADQPLGAPPLKLAASSDAAARVYYYVREGPAKIEGDTLQQTVIPPRAKWPVKVTVVAWQWGRSIEPRLQTAEPVERTFFIAPPTH